MAFHYTAPPATQHLLVLGLLGAGLALGATPAFADAWAGLVTSTSPWVLVTVGPWVINTVVFWALAVAFRIVDRTDRPAWVARHRIQSGPRREPPLGRTVGLLALNQLVVAPICLVGMAAILHARGWTASAALPGVVELVVDLGVLAVCALITFYAGHRFLHRPWWMKRVHRIHHEFRTTSAIAAQYAHPVEFVVANFGVLAAGVVLWMPSLAAIYLFTAIALTVIGVHHSGYALPFVSSPIHHDWHHYQYREMFGTVGVIDRLLGTDTEFQTLEDGEIR